MQGPCIPTGPLGLERSVHSFKAIFYDGFATLWLKSHLRESRLSGKNIATPLSR
jgi:hypothetical protein